MEYDIDDDGQITWEEFKKKFVEHGGADEKAEVKSKWDEINPEGKSTISFEMFFEYLKTYYFPKGIGEDDCCMFPPPLDATAHGTDDAKEADEPAASKDEAVVDKATE